LWVAKKLSAIALSNAPIRKGDPTALAEADCPGVETAPGLYGQAKLVSIVRTVDGDHATVTYRFDQPAIDQENQPWSYEAGAWRYDKC
jgi:hypothetical protein